MTTMEVIASYHSNTDSINNSYCVRIWRGLRFPIAAAYYTHFGLYEGCLHLKATSTIYNKTLLQIVKREINTFAYPVDYKVVKFILL